MWTKKTLKECVKCHIRIKLKICFTFYFRCCPENAPNEVSALMWIFWSSNTFSLELNYSELLWLQRFQRQRSALPNKTVCLFVFARSCRAQSEIIPLRVNQWFRIKRTLNRNDYWIPLFLAVSLSLTLSPAINSLLFSVICILLWFDWIDSERQITKKKSK